ncbi:transposase family protein [Streptomyces hydrogenans]|uniref:transposase family protein n=1 Tax=Streptomyces hydrogenans TaxID=1873719 RepID=UPI0037F9C593
MLAERGRTISPSVRLRTLAEAIDHLGAGRQAGILDGTEIQVCRPGAGRKDRDRFLSGENEHNAMKAMVLADQNGRMLFCGPPQPASCADITHARESGPVKLLADGPAVKILAEVGHRLVEPAAVRLSGELEHPVRHRDRRSVRGRLFHERVDPFPADAPVTERPRPGAGPRSPAPAA